MNDTAIDYQKLLTESLQNQIVILGPTITLAKARHVAGLHVENDGRVTSIDGNPQEVSIKLLEQFRELSPLMVKKTMKPLLSAIISSYPTATTDGKQTAVAPPATDQPQLPETRMHQSPDEAKPPLQEMKPDQSHETKQESA